MAGSGYTFTTATCATTASFAAIQISGQSSVLADSTLDTLTFTSVGPLLLTTNASTDTVSFSAAPHIAKIHTGTSGYLPYYTAGTEVSKSTGLYWDSSNSKLGVQTTAPSAHLTVSGHISARGNVICETLYVADQSIRFKNGARFLTTSAGNIVLMPAPNNGNQGTAIVITSGGKIVATPVSAINNYISATTDSLQSGNSTFTGFVSSNVVFSSGGNSGQWEVGYIDSQLNKTDITWVAASSSSWDHTYSTVKANSGAWSAGGTYAFKTVTLSGKNIAAAIGPDIAAESTTDTLTLCAGPNIALISDSATDTITISSVGGDGGAGAANEYSFKTITLSGQNKAAAIGPDVVADTTTDTLTLSAGPNIALISDPSTDTITISSVGGDGGGGGGGVTAVATVRANSGYWDQTVTTVRGNSAGWEYGESAHSTVQAESGYWDQTVTTVRANSGDWENGQANEYSFKTLSVAGQPDIVADTTTDTLSVMAGSNMTITSRATDTIVFAATDTNTTYTAGSGLELYGTQFSHENTSAQSSSDNSGRTYIQDITLDTYGHVTGLATATESTGEANEHSFKTITLSGQNKAAAIGPDVVADTTTDTFTLCAGPNIALISDPATDTITISSVGGDGGGGGGMSNWILEDGDGTEVTVADAKEVKFVEGNAGIDINWTDVSDGSDSDPYDLTFNIPFYSTVQSESGYWDQTVTTVRGNSAGWEKGEPAHSTLQANSGYWDQTLTTVRANSGDWSPSTGDTTTSGTLSARDRLIAGTGASLSGNVTIGGDLEILGDDIVMGTNTVGHILMGGGANFGPVAQTSITSVGTISAGAWQGTSVALGYGGTGLVGATDGKIVIADGSGAPVHLDVGSSTAITILGTVATGTWQGTAVADAYVAGSALWNWVASNSATKYEDTTVFGTLSARDRIIASVGASLSGDVTVGNDLIVGGNNLTINGVLYQFPGDNGDAGQQLQTNGSGVLSWEAAGSGGGSGDITDVIAGAGLTGGATSGSATLNVSGGALIDVTGNEVDVDLTEATEAAIANGDYIIFLDGGATGTHAKEAVADLATLFAGAGITATNSVIAVDAAQTGITSLLAADIKIGEDDQTKIDFETADEIHFYANNVHQVKLIDNAFTPVADSDVDLGTSSLYWKDAYIDTVRTTGNIVAAGTVSASDPGGSSYGSSPHWTYVADNSAGKINYTTQDIYTSISTDSNFNNVVLLLHCEDADGDTWTKDDSIRHHPLSGFSGGTVIETDQYKYGSASMYFPNANSHAVIPASPDWRFDGDFTWEFWMRTPGSVDTARRMMGYGGQLAAGPYYQHQWHISHANNAVYFYHGDPTWDLSSTTAIQASTWYHCAVSRTGSTLRLFLDGTQEDSATTSAIIGYNKDLWIGGNDYDGDGFPGGYLDDIRITKGVGRYTSNFTPAAHNGESIYQQTVVTSITGSATDNTGWILEDDDGTEVTVKNDNEVKFIGSGITTNWTDTTPGTDGDPFDLTFTVDAAQTGITSLLATDIKIGEDDQTKIDFETANEIHLYADNANRATINSSGASIVGTLSAKDRLIASTGASLSGNVTIGGDLEVLGDDIVMGTNTVGHILMGGGTNFGPVAQTSITSVGTVSAGTWQGTAIAQAYIAGDAIDGSKVADDAINSEHYTDGSIDTAHIADDQVTLAKMAGITRGSIIIGNASGNPAALAIGTNDYVLTSDGTDIAWEAASGGGGSSEWTDTGSVLHPTDSSGTADAVVIGGTTAGNSDIAFNTDGSAVFNEQSASVDFRVESNGNANMLFVDGSADSVGIGTSLPEAELSVAGEISARDGFSSSVKAHTDLTSNGVVTYNITGPALQTIVLKANQTNTYLGSETLPVGKTVTIRLSACGANRTLAWHGSMNFVGEKPASIASGKQALLSITTFGTVCATAGKSDVTCAYAVED